MASLSSSFIDVGVNMVLRDQFSQNAGRVTGAFQTMMNNLQATGRAVRDSYGEIFDVAVSTTRGIYNAYKAYAGVEKDIFLTGKMADATNEQIKELRDLAEQTNLEVPLTTGDIASAEKFLAMAGNSVQEIKDMIPAISKLSSLFGMKAGGKGGVADLMTNIMSMYQIPSSQIEQVANDLYVATTSANMSLPDLANSIKYAGAELATMGYGVRETAAAIGLLGDMGIQGSMAGTALANSMRYLRQSLTGQKQSGAAALEKLGLSKEDFLDARGELIDLYKVYKTIADAGAKGGFTGFEISDMITAITGVRGSRNMLAVIRQLQAGNDTYSKIYGRYTSRAGALNEAAEEYQNSPQGRLDKLKSTLDALQQRLGQMAATFLNPFLEGVNWFLGILFKISDNPIMKFIMTGGIGLALVSPLTIGVKMMRQLVVSLRETIIMTQAALNRVGLTAKQMYQNAAYAQATIAQAATLQKGQRLAMGGGAYFAMGRNGKPYLSYVDDNGKRRRSSSQAFQQTWLVNQKTPRGGTVQQGNTFGKLGVLSRFNSIHGPVKTVGAALPMVGKGLLRVGSVVAGLAGGPIGIALIAGTILLPKLIDALSSNTKSQEDVLEEKRKEIMNMSTQDYFAYREKKIAAAFESLKTGAIGTVHVRVNGEDIIARAGDFVTVDDLHGVIDAAI